MWKSGTVVLLTVVVVGCATRHKSRHPHKSEGPEQVQAPEQSQTREQRQKGEQRQKRIAADQERIAADKERIAARLERDLGPICTSAGLTPGTDAHSRCMDSLYRLELELKAAKRLLPR